MRGIAVRAEYAAFMGECERLGVSVGGNAESRYMVFRRTLVRDDAALRGGDGLGGEGGVVDLRYGADVALVCARMVLACFRESVAPSVFAACRRWAFSCFWVLMDSARANRARMRLLLARVATWRLTA